MFQLFAALLCILVYISFFFTVSAWPLFSLLPTLTGSGVQLDAAHPASHHSGNHNTAVILTIKGTDVKHATPSAD